MTPSFTIQSKDEAIRMTKHMVSQSREAWCWYVAFNGQFRVERVTSKHRRPHEMDRRRYHIVEPAKRKTLSLVSFLF